MLQPSDAHLWVPCPLAGAVLGYGTHTPPASPVADQTASDSRREGICAHWVAENVFTGREAAPAYMIGEAHPNGWVVDDEMAWHCQNYVNYVQSFGVPTAVEMPVELFDLIRGRLDIITSGNPEVLRVFAFKYGWQVVDVESLWADLCYAIGASGGRPTAIEIHLYQPRPYHPDGPARVWRIEEHEYEAWAGWLRDRAQACQDPQAPARPGKQCVDCPLVGQCQGAAEHGYAAYDITVGREMVNHTPAQIIEELKFLRVAERVITARRKMIESEMLASMKRGQHMNGAVMGKKKGHRKYTITPDQVWQFTGHNPWKEKPELKSPAEMEREGVPRYLIDMITDSPTIGYEVILEPENLAKRLFGK